MLEAKPRQTNKQNNKKKENENDILSGRETKTQSTKRPNRASHKTEFSKTEKCAFQKKKNWEKKKCAIKKNPKNRITYVRATATIKQVYSC